METPHKHKFSGMILAAGGGTRMKSALPKVLHPLAGEPMIGHVLAALAPLSPRGVAVVVAPGMDKVRAFVAAKQPVAAFAVQESPQGTGDAVRSGLAALPEEDSIVLVLYGDTPLIQPQTLQTLLDAMEREKADIALLGMKPDDPTGYGRLVMNAEPWVERIVECKDASPAEKAFRWVWGGVMAFGAGLLREQLAALKPSPVTGEYYLTALIGMTAAKGGKTLMVPMSAEEAMGVNDRSQLAQAERVMQDRLRKKAMLSGVTMIDPATVYLQADTHIGRDSILHPHIVFGPKVSVAEGVEIRSFSHIEGAQIESGAIVGPFARIRPGSVVGEGAHVGNFVELKNTKLGKGAKANHLSYVGDANIGPKANIGAGTITCNYDGFNKHTTVIGAEAFIGSNASLVAPVSIGDGAIVGAGSVITEDVPANALALGRGRQVNKEGKAKLLREKNKK